MSKKILVIGLLVTFVVVAIACEKMLPSSPSDDSLLDGPVEGLSAWTDAALLNAAGIPAICFGPGDIALAHAAEEYVPVNEIEQATAVLTHVATEWMCR